MQPLPLHRTIVVVDVAGFTHPARTMTHQRAVREGLYEVLTKALADAGIDLSLGEVEDRGDGMLILIPPDVPKMLLADQFPLRLAASLRRYNATHSAEAAVRLRVGLHAGEVTVDQHGAMGAAINLAFRIVDAPEAKEALRESRSALAVIATESFYHDVILQGVASQPHLYRQIPVQVKETSSTAWVRLSDEPITTQFEPHSTTLRSGIPVAIYVSNGAIHHRVESAVQQLLASADLEVEYIEDPVRGGLLDG